MQNKLAACRLIRQIGRLDTTILRDEVVGCLERLATHKIVYLQVEARKALAVWRGTL